MLPTTSWSLENSLKFYEHSTQISIGLSEPPVTGVFLTALLEYTRGDAIKLAWNVWLFLSNYRESFVFITNLGSNPFPVASQDSTST